MSPGAPGSPDRSCQEPVSTVRRHKQFADVADPNKGLLFLFYSLLLLFLLSLEYFNVLSLMSAP